MKTQAHIILITTITIMNCFISSSGYAQNTGEILVIPENVEEVTSNDGIRFSKDGYVIFPSGGKIKIDFDLESPHDSNREDDSTEDK